jgi:hypothetical protein
MARKVSVMILRWKSRLAAIRKIHAAVAAFTASTLSAHRVARRFDSYSPNIAKIRCQMASIAAKMTKFHSFTLTEKISTRDILPDWEADKIMDTTNDAIKTARSNVFNELTMNLRLVSFMGLSREPLANFNPGQLRTSREGFYEISLVGNHQADSI